MNQDEIKSNLLDTNQWIRILFMAGFALAAWLVLVGLIVLVLVQTFIVLVSGETNRNLRKVGYLFGCYLHEIVQYLCYNTSTKPFPFADFPEAAERAAEMDDDDEAPITTETHSPASFNHRPEAGDAGDKENPRL